MVLNSTEDKEIMFAYHTIHDFFDTYLLQDAIGFLSTILGAAISHTSWKRSCPFNVLLYMDHLGKLSAAAFKIQKMRSRRKEAIIPHSTSHPGSALLHAASGNKQGDHLWSCFPRNLSLPQFYDPYKALKKFCTYRTQPEWTETLADMQEYALSRATINDVYPEYNILKLRLRLSQLIEACHLLEVRTNIISKQPKTKSKAR